MPVLTSIVHEGWPIFDSQGVYSGPLPKTDGKKATLIGKTGNTFLTSGSAAWPEELCKCFADSAVLKIKASMVPQAGGLEMDIEPKKGTMDEIDELILRCRAPQPAVGGVSPNTQTQMDLDLLGDGLAPNTGKECEELDFVVDGLANTVGKALRQENPSKKPPRRAARRGKITENDLALLADGQQKWVNGALHREGWSGWGSSVQVEEPLQDG